MKISRTFLNHHTIDIRSDVVDNFFANFLSHRQILQIGKVLLERRVFEVLRIKIDSNAINNLMVNYIQNMYDH
jgi:hypothetical protein